MINELTLETPITNAVILSIVEHAIEKFQPIGGLCYMLADSYRILIDPAINRQSETFSKISNNFHFKIYPFLLMWRPLDINDIYWWEKDTEGYNRRLEVLHEMKVELEKLITEDV